MCTDFDFFREASFPFIHCENALLLAIICKEQKMKVNLQQFNKRSHVSFVKLVLNRQNLKNIL